MMKRIILIKEFFFVTEVIEFTNKIISSVSKKYGVSLDREPELVGSDQRA